MTNPVYDGALYVNVFGILCIYSAIDVTWLAFPHYFEDYHLCRQLLYHCTFGVIQVPKV